MLINFETLSLNWIWYERKASISVRTSFLNLRVSAFSWVIKCLSSVYQVYCNNWEFWAKAVKLCANLLSHRHFSNGNSPPASDKILERPLSFLELGYGNFSQILWSVDRFCAENLGKWLRYISPHVNFTLVHFNPVHFTPRTFHPTYISPHVISFSDSLRRFQ